MMSVLATLLALLPLDEIELDEGADEVPIMVVLVQETFDGIVKLFDKSNPNITDGGQFIK